MQKKIQHLFKANNAKFWKNVNIILIIIAVILLIGSLVTIMQFHVFGYQEGVLESIKLTGLFTLVIPEFVLEILKWIIIATFVFLIIEFNMKKPSQNLFMLTNILFGLSTIITLLTSWYLGHNYNIEALTSHQSVMSLNEVDYSTQHRIWCLLWPAVLFGLLAFLLFEVFQIKNKQYMNKRTQRINQVFEYVLFFALGMFIFNSSVWYMYIIYVVISLICIKHYTDEYSVNTEKSAKKKQA